MSKNEKCTNEKEISAQDQELDILVDQAKIFAPASSNIAPITDQSN